MQQELEMSLIDAVKPPAAYIGGKKELAQKIASIIEQLPHKLYAEPFVGMGGVFFRRRVIPRCEVINDISGDAVTLFRILQRHYPQFMETLKFQITSRKEFERLTKCDPSTLTDLERAARFLYLQRTAFGGKVTGRNFGVIYDGGARFNLSHLGSLLSDIHERLSGVIVENLDWRNFIDRYDRPDTLFYLDPPYYGCEDDYGSNVFSRKNFTDLASKLSKIEGRFILSLNECEEVRNIFSEFKFSQVSLNYSISGGQKAVKEVIILDKKEPPALNLPR